MRKGQIVGIGWNRIARLHSQVLASYEITNNIATSHPTRSRCHNALSHSIRSQRVVGSNPIWDSEFSE